ncbi:1327_t:CDS:2, partial [Dentiscutata heterogama]
MPLFDLFKREEFGSRFFLFCLCCELDESLALSLSPTLPPPGGVV